MAFTWYSESLETKFNETAAGDTGMLHFAAAGNAASSDLYYPAAFEIVNAVANVTPVGLPNPDSNYGPDLSLAAPGTHIYTTDRMGAAGHTPGNYVFINGTSFATPIGTAAIALLQSVAPGLSLAGQKAALLDTVDPLPALQGRVVSEGRLNAGAAVRAVLDPASMMFPPLVVKYPACPMFVINTAIRSFSRTKSRCRRYSTPGSGEMSAKGKV